MKFTIRDLLWLTVVAGLALGWSLREQQLRRELERAEAWRGRAGTLEHFLSTRDWKVDWNRHDSGASVLQYDQEILLKSQAPSDP